MRTSRVWRQGGGGGVRAQLPACCAAGFAASPRARPRRRCGRVAPGGQLQARLTVSVSRSKDLSQSWPAADLGPRVKALRIFARTEDNRLLTIALAKAAPARVWPRLFRCDPDGARCLRPPYLLAGRCRSLLRSLIMWFQASWWHEYVLHIDEELCRCDLLSRPTGIAS